MHAKPVLVGLDERLLLAQYVVVSLRYHTLQCGLQHFSIVEVSPCHLFFAALKLPDGADSGFCWTPTVSSPSKMRPTCSASESQRDRSQFQRRALDTGTPLGRSRNQGRSRHPRTPLIPPDTPDTQAPGRSRCPRHHGMPQTPRTLPPPRTLRTLWTQGHPPDTRDTPAHPWMLLAHQEHHQGSHHWKYQPSQHTQIEE